MWRNTNPRLVERWTRTSGVLQGVWLVVCAVFLSCAGPTAAADVGAGTVTLKSGRTYRVYGDILVPFEAPPGVEGALTGNRWPQAVLFYAFDGSVSAQQQNDFRQWVLSWEEGSGVRLTENPAAPNHVLLQIASDIGCGHSAIGMLGGVQDIVIDNDPGCWTSGVVLHEVGHALDLIHEQQRSDRDSFVSITDHGIVANCGQATWDANYGIVATDTASAYDYASIMHYPSQGHYTCNGVDVWADITVLQAQPAGPPPGSENACTSVADCQATIGSATISARDEFSMALRYGYEIDLVIAGNGTGATFVSGERENCGTDCYLVTPDSVFTVTATPDPGSIASFSGLCHGRTCEVQPTANGTVRVRYTKRASIAAVATLSTRPKPNSIFSNGFDPMP